MLHCGLYAVNAICGAAGDRVAPTDAAELDECTRVLHARERIVHPEGDDNAPDPAGNYPVEALMLALQRRHLKAAFVPHAAALLSRPLPRPAATAAFAPCPGVLGYIVATGGHYVAVVRSTTGGGGWRLVDNGNITAQAATPWPLLGRVAHACAVLRVEREAKKN